MAYVRLKANHPTAKKIEKLMTLLDELGLTVCFNSYRTTIQDKETGQEYYLCDNDIPASSESGTIRSLPCQLEYKLIRYEGNE